MSSYDESVANEVEFAPAHVDTYEAPRELADNEEHEVDALSYDAGYVEGDEPKSRVREVLETSNAWNALMANDVVRSQVHYTEDGLEGDPRMAPELRARLFLAATAILHAHDVQYDAEHQGVFFVRELAH